MRIMHSNTKLIVTRECIRITLIDCSPYSKNTLENIEIAILPFLSLALLLFQLPKTRPLLVFLNCWEKKQEKWASGLYQTNGSVGIDDGGFKCITYFIKSGL